MRGSASIASAFTSLANRFFLCFSYCFLFTLGFSLSLTGQTSSGDPDYVWLNKADLPTVTVTELNTEDLTISIAADPQGNIYALSFGDGVDKLGADGNLIEKG